MGRCPPAILIHIESILAPKILLYKMIHHDNRMKLFTLLLLVAKLVKTELCRKALK